jgi:hypothetical protein
MTGLLKAARRYRETNDDAVMISRRERRRRHPSGGLVTTMRGTVRHGDRLRSVGDVAGTERSDVR